MSPRPESRRAGFALGLGLLSAAVWLLWRPAQWASFQFDDWSIIVHDPRVGSLAAWTQAMPGIRPLLKLSYAVNAQWGHGVGSYRSFNVALHILNTVLIGLLFRRKALDWEIGEARAASIALFTAALFAFHPVQTEAITYVSGRSAALEACFALASLYAWSGSESARTVMQRSLMLTLCVLLMMLAIACKETAAGLPLVLALWSRSQPQPVPLLPRLLAPLMVSAALLVMAMLWPPYHRLLSFSLQLLPLIDNLLTELHAWTWLAGQLLCIDAPNADPLLPLVLHADGTTRVLLIAWSTAIVLALGNLRGARPLAFGLLWFLGWLLPTNGLLPRLDIANDRQLYVAMAGPVFALAVLLGQLLDQHPRLAGTIAFLLIAGLMTATARRNRDYATEISFWERTATQNPSSGRAANNLGMAYAIACRKPQAEAEFRRALALDPADPRTQLNLRELDNDQLPGADCTRLDSL